MHVQAAINSDLKAVCRLKAYRALHWLGVGMTWVACDCLVFVLMFFATNGAAINLVYVARAAFARIIFILVLIVARRADIQDQATLFAATCFQVWALSLHCDKS